MQEARLALVGVLAAAVFGCCVAADALVTYRDEALRYEVKYPAAWRVLPKNKGFQIASYPASEAPKGGFPPHGGALIMVHSPPQRTQRERALAMTLRGWIDYELAWAEREGENPSVRHLRVEAGCTETRTTPEIGPNVREENLACYFESGGRLFAMALAYWPEDPKAAEYRKVYEDVIRSFRNW